MNKIELIAPAGNLEKLKTAIQFGADAVYLGDKRFSLRACAYKGNLYVVEVRNRMLVGDDLEVLTPGENIPVKRVKNIYDLDKNELQESHANDTRIIELYENLQEGCLLRRKK